MSNNEEFNLQEILKENVNKIMSENISFVKQDDIDETYEDPLKKFEGRYNSDLSLEEINEKISILTIRCGHWFITHNFTKNDELELELKNLINIRDSIIQKNNREMLN